MEKTNDTRVLYFVLGAVILGHLAVINHQRFLPFADIPTHLAEAAVYRYSGQADNRFAEYYPFRLFPYASVFHVVFMGSSLFPTVETGCKVFHSLYILLLPLSVFWLIRRLGGDVWWSLLSFLFLTNRNLYWGMAGFTLSVAVLFPVYILMLRTAEDDRPVTAVALALAFLLLYVIHYLMALFSLFVFLTLLCLSRRRSASRIFLKGLVAVPLAGMLVLAWRVKGVPGLGTYLWGYYRNGPGISLAWRVKQLMTFDNAFLLNGRISGDNIAFFFSLAVAALVFFAVVVRPGTPAQSAAGSRRAVVPLLLCSLLCFFLLPEKIPGHGAEYQRFSSIFFLALIVTGSLFSAGSSRVFKTVLCVLVLMHLALWGHRLVQFDRENRGFDKEFLPADARDKTLTAVIDEYMFGQTHPYIHFPSYYIVWRHGIAATVLTTYPYMICSGLQPERRAPYYPEFYSRDDSLATENFNVDYLLTRGELYPKHRDFIGKRFRLLRSSGKWSLYQRKK